MKKYIDNNSYDQIEDIFQIDNPHNLELKHCLSLELGDFYGWRRFDDFEYVVYITRFRKQHTYFDGLNVPFMNMKFYPREPKDPVQKLIPIFEIYLPVNNPKFQIIEPEKLLCPKCGSDVFTLKDWTVAFGHYQRRTMARITFAKVKKGMSIRGHFLHLICWHCNHVEMTPYADPSRFDACKRNMQPYLYAIQRTLIKKVVVPRLNLTFTNKILGRA